MIDSGLGLPNICDPFVGSPMLRIRRGDIGLFVVTWGCRTFLTFLHLELEFLESECIATLLHSVRRVRL